MDAMDALAQIPGCACGYWYNETELHLISGLPKDEFKRCGVTTWTKKNKAWDTSKLAMVSVRVFQGSPRVKFYMPKMADGLQRVHMQGKTMQGVDQRIINEVRSLNFPPIPPPHH